MFYALNFVFPFLTMRGLEQPDSNVLGRYILFGVLIAFVVLLSLRDKKE